MQTETTDLPINLRAARRFGYADIQNLVAIVLQAVRGGRLNVGFVPSSGSEFVYLLSDGYRYPAIADPIVGNAAEMENALMALYHLAQRYRKNETLRDCLYAYGVFAPEHHLGRDLVFDFEADGNREVIVEAATLQRLCDHGFTLVVLRATRGATV